MKRKNGMSAGFFVLLVMLAGLAAPARAAVRSMRHTWHSRSYGKAHAKATGYHPANIGHTLSRYGSQLGLRHAGRYGSRRARSAAFQQAPMPDRIQEIQTAMAQQGAYQGEPSGKWDDATSDALRSYQERSGLTPTGKLDAASLQHLGLGSDVAGLNPPKAVLPAAAPTANAAVPAK